MPADFELPGFDEVEVVGRGAFGVVYRARQVDFNRLVAIKILTGDFDEQARSRFDRERQALGALSSHPNIVSVYASGATGDGRPYIVMEYAPGGSLADRITETGPLPWSEAATIGAKLADALGAAHAAGVLHRDVKPENVLFSAYGEAMLADFGIAQIAGQTATRTGIVTASLAHASPEVLDGKRPSPEADLYSLASTIFAAITGRAPFMRDDDESMITVIARTATEAPPDLRSRGIPDSLCSTLERGLAKNPDDRFPSAADLAAALRAAAGDTSQPARPLPPPPPSSAGASGAKATRVQGQADVPGWRRPGVLAGAAVALVLLIGGVVFAVSQGSGPSPTPSTSTTTATTTAGNRGPAQPATLTGFTKNGAPTTATQRIFQGQPGYLDNFPWTMNGCNDSRTTTTWRSLVPDDVVTAGPTDVHGSSTLQAADVKGTTTGTSGLITADGCQEPVFFLVSSPAGDTLVDIAYTTQKWSAAP